MKTKTILLTLKTLAFILFSQLAFCADVTWSGGTGDWMDATNWDTGTVPTANESVLIPSGIARIRAGEYAMARNVEVEANGRLNIFAKGHLDVSGSTDLAAINNEGKVYVWGELTIRNVAIKGSLIGSGIQNIKTFFVGINGIVDIDDVDNGYGIYNKVPGTFTNKGDIKMTNVDRDQIRNLETFYNRGTIELYDNVGHGILNKNAFTNFETGEIFIQYGSWAVSNNPNATFDNKGLIDVLLTNYGLVNKGLFNNEELGSLTIREAIQCITNRNIAGANNGEIFNYGHIQAHYSTTGLRNEDYFYNEGHLGLVDFNTKGLYNVSGSLVNEGSLSAQGSSYAINNEGSIFNGSEGSLDLTDKLINGANGYVENNGFVKSYTTVSHDLDNSSTFLNNAVVQDEGNTFSGPGFDNQQIYVRQITGPLVSGTYYYDAIEVVSTSNVTIGDWKDAISNWNIAGTYDNVLGAFLADSAAEGLDAIYISMDLNANGRGSNIKLNIDNPASSSNSNSIDQFDVVNDMKLVMNDSDVYPNPFVNELNIKSPENQVGDVVYHVYDSIGQCVLIKTVGDEVGQFKINLGSDKNSGLYHLVAMKDNKIIMQKQLVMSK